MPTTVDLVQALKRELKSAGVTYAALARELDMAESTVKRMFAVGDMPLTRIDAILRVLRIDLGDLARGMLDAEPRLRELTLEQEKEVVKDPKLLLMAISCLSQWPAEQVAATYAYTEAEIVKCLSRLDRLGIIELRPGNRYALRVDKTFRWRPDGPAMHYFRAHVVGEYFSGRFDAEGEAMLLVHGSMAPNAAAAFAERLARLAADFSQQHLADQRLPAGQRAPYTLLVASRSWWFGAFQDLMRPGVRDVVARPAPTRAAEAAR